jgi:hypothetical protein
MRIFNLNKQYNIVCNLERAFKEVEDLKNKNQETIILKSCNPL